MSYAGETNPTDFQVKSDDAHDGETAFHFYSTEPMEFEIQQTITGLEDGSYQLYVFAQGGDMSEDVELELYAVTGGQEQTASFALTGWANWKMPKISKIEVKDGTVTIGVRMKCNAGSWGTVDEFVLNRIFDDGSADESETSENLLLNPGFEESDTSMWKLINNGADGAIWFGNDNVKTGNGAFRFWSESDLDFAIEQELNGLEPGNYQLSVFSQGGDSMTDDNSKLELYAVSTDGGEVTESFLLTGWENWKNPVIQTIKVGDDGKLTIGVRMKCPAGSWGSLDDFVLTKLSE